MKILQQEIKSQRLAIVIWSLSIGLLIAVCVLMYPEMKAEMTDVNEIFASMGSFSSAFGMDQLNFGTLIGFYAVEGGNMLGIGGAFFAAIVGITSLMKEEKDRTAEFLFTHPLTRGRVLLEKVCSIYIILLIMNLIVYVISVVSILVIGEKIDWTVLSLIHLAYFLMQCEIAMICFGISAFLRKGGIGIGIGVAAGLYFLNIVANISQDAKALKYITPFAYTEGYELINNKKIPMEYLISGMILMLAGIIVASVYYRKKDIFS